MKLVKQSRLFFRQGKSDKVYEVDLCEVSDGKFVVNFRYGRRGATLREGTKTTAPMALGDAERVFNQLVDSKTSKGYCEDTGPQMTEPKVSKPLSPADTDARNNAILQRLRDGKNSASKWPLSRAIWRAGELKLLDAEPILRSLVGIDEMTDYCVAWAMARIGQNTSIPTLENIARSSSNRGHVRHLASQALRLVADEESRDSLVEQAIESLPDPLRSFVKNGSVAAFEQALLEGLNKQYEPSILSALYYIDTPAVRPSLLRALAQVPLEPPFFQTIRRLYKTAELRRDGQVFGLLGHRFETSRAMYRRPSYVWRNYRNPSAETNPKKAFSAHTRGYLRRRVWRALDRMGKLGDKDFVPMAVGVLLAFSDEDAQPVRTDSRYSWSTRSYVNFQWDPYGAYWALNQLLFRNSPRYEAIDTQLTYRIVQGGSPNSVPPAENEAAYPELWQAQPRGLVHLLTDSRCLIVHQFAAKTLRRCEEFCEQLPLEVLLLFLASDYDVTSELGFDLAIKRYDPAHPNFDLVLALANSGLPRARGQAHQWIGAQRNVFFVDTEFAAKIFTSPHADTRNVGLESTHALPSDPQAIRALTGRLVAFLQSCREDQGEIAEDIGHVLLRPNFGPSVSALGEDVLCDLL
ncbi:MAG: WGR domain-containing protein, partial [Planctomycetota bacterium]